MKKLLIVMFIVLGMLCSNANAYTFDGEFDPKEVFNYQLIGEPEQVGADMFILHLENAVKKPKYIVTVVRTLQGRVLIIAYAYFDEVMKLRHFILTAGHYKEGMPDIETVIMLEKKLYKLHGITDA